MSFKETEFPSWVAFLKSLEKKNSNPFLLRDIVRLMIQLYEKIPLYPGIVEMCLNAALQFTEPEKLQMGEKIYFHCQGRYYTGEILSKSSSTIKVRAENNTLAEQFFPINELKQIVRLNEKVLEELWPSLVFEQKENGI